MRSEICGRQLFIGEHRSPWLTVVEVTQNKLNFFTAEELRLKDLSFDEIYSQALENLKLELLDFGPISWPEKVGIKLFFGRTLFRNIVVLPSNKRGHRA
jgi:hypothetical protein